MSSPVFNEDNFHFIMQFAQDSGKFCTIVLYKDYFIFCGEPHCSSCPQGLLYYNLNTLGTLYCPIDPTFNSYFKELFCNPECYYHYFKETNKGECLVDYFRRAQAEYSKTPRQ